VRYVGADSETVPFSPGDMAPALVCIQDQTLGSTERNLTTRVNGALRRIEGWLDDPETTLVLHNAAYDAAVWSAEGLYLKVRDAYRQGRILCTHTYERLGEISGATTRKNLKLGPVCEAHGIPAPDQKGTELAREFGQFLHATDIPDPWRRYALDDCVVIRVFERQRRRFEHSVPLRALQLLSYRQFCLQLSAVWGLRVDERGVEALEATALAELERLIPHARDLGFIRWGKCTRQKLPAEDWIGCKRVIQAAVTEAYNGTPPMTQQPRKASPTWAPQVSVDATTLAESGDPDLVTFSKFGEWCAVKNKDLPMLRDGGGLIHTRYNIADTCRTTSSKPAIQNWRSGLDAKPGVVVPMIRECVVPRPGHAILSVDYAGLELASFAQNVATQLGQRNMAGLLNTGVDLHARIGARLAGLSYDEFRRRVKAGDKSLYWFRQVGKGANFGFQGGMGNPEKFARYCATNYKTPITIDQAKQAKQIWREESPDGVAWLDYVSSTQHHDKTFDVFMPGFGVTRRGVWYNAAANNPFQELGAFVCSEATIALTEAFYGGSLPYARIIAHVHDEWLVEVPVECVAEADRAICALLRDVAARCLPDVRSCVPEAKAMNRWSKRAKELRDADGRLQVWSEAA
jgi:hypothetical protein